MFHDGFQIYVSTDVTMAAAQSKWGQKCLFKKIYIFLNSNFANGINSYLLLTLPIFVMFHPSSAKVQHSNFNQDDVIICEFINDFEIIFGRKNKLIMSYPCTEFHYNTTINKGNIMYFSFIFVRSFWNGSGLSVSEVIIYDAIKFFGNRFLTFERTLTMNLS